MLILTSKENANSQWVLLCHAAKIIFITSQFITQTANMTHHEHRRHLMAITITIENIISVTLLGLRIYGGFINLAY